MNKFLYSFVSIFVITLMQILTSHAENSVNAVDTQLLKFRVFLDDTAIGYHQVNIHQQDNKTHIHTTANFEVTFFFIPVYSYEHETKEIWEKDCVVNIQSTTNDNGDKYFINGHKTNDHIVLKTHKGHEDLSGCIRTFAYWDLDLLKQNQLLNTQTGDYLKSSLTEIGMTQLDLNDSTIEAYQVRLTSKEGTIDLWYSRDRQWLALESETESGAMLRYQLEITSESGAS